MALFGGNIADIIKALQAQQAAQPAAQSSGSLFGGVNPAAIGQPQQPGFGQQVVQPAQVPGSVFGGINPTLVTQPQQPQQPVGGLAAATAQPAVQPAAPAAPPAQMPTMMPTQAQAPSAPAQTFGSLFGGINPAAITQPRQSGFGALGGMISNQPAQQGQDSVGALQRMMEMIKQRKEGGRSSFLSNTRFNRA